MNLPELVLSLLLVRVAVNVGVRDKPMPLDCRFLQYYAHLSL